MNETFDAYKDWTLEELVELLKYDTQNLMKLNKNIEFHMKLLELKQAEVEKLYNEIHDISSMIFEGILNPSDPNRYIMEEEIDEMLKKVSPK